MRKASCQLSVVSCQSQQKYCAPALATKNWQLTTAFTLTELLIVIGLIVLILVMAVPALDFITGSRSIDGAQNQISAMLGRARAEAIGLQEPAGVMFVINPTSREIDLYLVHEAPFPTGGTAQIYLDLVENRDTMSIPPGVGLQVVEDANIAGSVRTDDGYLGYNEVGAKQVGGVILFDGFGRIMNVSYGLLINNAFAVPPQTQMGGMLELTTPDFVDPVSSTLPLRTNFAFVLFELNPFREQFGGEGADLDPQISGGGYSPDELNEETWLDANALPLLVNRYNGTLVKGE